MVRAAARFPCLRQELSRRGETARVFSSTQRRGMSGRFGRWGLVMSVAALACGSVAGTTSAASRESAKQSSQASIGGNEARPCAKRKRGSTPSRVCRRRQTRPLPVVEPETVAQPQGQTVLPAPDPIGPPPPAPPLPPKQPPIPGDPPPPPDPEEPPVTTPPCEASEEDCVVYSDKYWELLAKYKRFEIAPGVYPYHPSCMEAWERGESVACAAVIVSLRPDGTLGPGP